MWLYRTSHSSAETVGSTLPSPSLCQALAASATLNGTSRAPASWLKAWTREPWIAQTFGPTLQLSTLRPGEGSPALLSADSPVSRSPRGDTPTPASVGSTTLDGFGTTCYESSSTAERTGSSPKTSPDCSPPSEVSQCGVSLPRWPKWGSLRSGVVSTLPPLARLSSGSAFSFWPTVWASGMGYRQSLNAWVKRRSEKRIGIPLDLAARLWAMGFEHSRHCPEIGTSGAKRSQLSLIFTRWLMGLPSRPLPTCEVWETWSARNRALLQSAFFSILQRYRSHTYDTTSPSR